MKICFWCDKVLDKDKETRDHLLSKRMRKMHNKKSSITQCSCYECNQLRSRITSAFVYVYQKNQCGWGSTEKKRKALKSLHKILNGVSLLFFREKIKNKVPPEYRELCLYEVNFVDRTFARLKQAMYYEESKI